MRVANYFLDSGHWIAFILSIDQVCGICLISRYHLIVFVIVSDQEVDNWWTTKDNKQDGDVTTSQAGSSPTTDAMETV